MSLIDGSTVLARNGERSARRYLKGVVIEPRLTLNETAAAIYEALDGISSLNHICQQLLKEYEVERDQLLGDAISLMQELLAEDAGRIVGAA